MPLSPGRIVHLALTSFLFLALAPGPLSAETLVLQNGLEVQGYLVGFRDGEYLVKIGSFTKRVPETDVAEVLEDGTAPADHQPSHHPAPSISGGLAQVLEGISRGIRQHGATGPGGFDLGRLMERIGQGGGGPLPMPDPKMIEALVKKFQAGHHDSSIQLPGAKAIEGILKQVPGGQRIPGLENLGQLFSGSGGNHPLEGMLEKVHDREFQKALIKRLEALSQAAKPGQENPYIPMLEGLFERLNSLHASLRQDDDPEGHQTESGDATELIDEE